VCISSIGKENQQFAKSLMVLSSDRLNKRQTALLINKGWSEYSVRLNSSSLTSSSFRSSSYPLLFTLGLAFTLTSQALYTIPAFALESPPIPDSTSFAPVVPFQVISSIELDTQSQQLLIQGNLPFKANESYRVKTLSRPARVVVEFPNTQLSLTKKFFKFDHPAIRELEAQTLNGEKPTSRITLYLRSAKQLKSFQVSPQNTLLSLSLPQSNQEAKDDIVSMAASALPIPSAPKSTAPPVPEASQQRPSALTESLPIPEGASVIQDISYRDGLLLIKSNTGKQVIPKNRFVLSDPSRLVLDLDKAVVADKKLLKPIYINGDSISQVRVGQFNADTVRLVIESQNPERLQMAYEGVDKSVLSVSNALGMSVSQLPAAASLGNVQDVKIYKDGGDTIIRLSATAPIVHRLVKDDSKILVELANLSAKQGGIPFEKTQFPQLEYVKLDALTPGEPNSKLVIDTQASDVEMARRYSADRKILEIKLFDNNSAIHSATGRYFPSTEGALASAGRSPYPARVVIDPGHGGKDMGANREGYMEKELNLTVALKLKRSLEARGIKVYMTRSSDIFLPLSQITQITNDIRPDLFVSVHTNSSTNPSIYGIETYYYTPQSVALAKRVHNRMVNNVSSPDRGVRKAMFYVIHHTSVPAILCEMGYISNEAERASLFSEHRKQKTADAIAEGVVDYLKARVSASAK
jgi:N-acetylmuramoyl-L-alanine amidase